MFIIVPFGAQEQRNGPVDSRRSMRRRPAHEIPALHNMVRTKDRHANNSPQSHQRLSQTGFPDETSK
jgi:hypothetical protein